MIKIIWTQSKGNHIQTFFIEYQQIIKSHPILLNSARLSMAQLSPSLFYLFLVSPFFLQVFVFCVTLIAVCGFNCFNCQTAVNNKTMVRIPEGRKHTKHGILCNIHTHAFLAAIAAL